MDDADSTTFLMQLLDTCRADPPIIEDLLERLLELAPTEAEIEQHRTMFDALDLNYETAHSKCLAWLLDPNGPLPACWLLQRLFEHALPEHRWLGTPLRVEAEVTEGGERPDIVVFWEDFRLVIEYKIDSPETSLQVRRYLKTFEIDSPSVGAVLYITKYGQWPASVAIGDRRVRAISYEDLVRHIDEGLRAREEPSERGRVIVAEYRNSLAHAINRSFSMDKPVFSDGTKLLLQQHRKFDALRAIAFEESGEFIYWLSRECETRMRPILGVEMEWRKQETKKQSQFVYRRPHWSSGFTQFGLGFGVRRIGEHFLTGMDLWLGVMVPTPQDGDEAGRNALSARIANALTAEWPLGKLEKPEAEWPLWQYAKYDPADDPFKWADSILEKVSKLAAALSPSLDRFISPVEMIPVINRSI